jgi:hypothetical protein
MLPALSAGNNSGFACGGNGFAFGNPTLLDTDALTATATPGLSSSDVTANSVATVGIFSPL